MFAIVTPNLHALSECWQRSSPFLLLTILPLDDFQQRSRVYTHAYVTNCTCIRIYCEKLELNTWTFPSMSTPKMNGTNQCCEEHAVENMYRSADLHRL